MVHGGEGVFTRDQMAAMGGGGDPIVNLKFAPGTEWLRKFVHAEVESTTGVRRVLPAGALRAAVAVVSVADTSALVPALTVDGVPAALPWLRVLLPDKTIGWFQRTQFDCLTASLATACKIPYEDVGDVRWHGDLEAWAEARGLSVEIHDDGPPAAARWIGFTPVRRLGWRHTVVGSYDRVIHDPAAGWGSSRAASAPIRSARSNSQSPSNQWESHADRVADQAEPVELFADGLVYGDDGGDGVERSGGSPRWDVGDVRGRYRFRVRR